MGQQLSEALGSIFRGAAAAEDYIERQRTVIEDMHAQNVRYYNIIVAYENAALPVPLEEWVGPIE